MPAHSDSKIDNAPHTHLKYLSTGLKENNSCIDIFYEGF